VKDDVRQMSAQASAPTDEERQLARRLSSDTPNSGRQQIIE
jgi:hypothetical protein